MAGHWLFKSEPGVFSIADLARAPGATTGWDGVRNYQARNLLRDEVQRGDLVLFYHSSAEPTGVAGVAEVVREAYPDATQFDPQSDHFDAGASRDDPRWMAVDVRLVRAFPRVVALAELKAEPSLAGMEVLRRGSRLSIQRASPAEFATITRMADSAAATPATPATPPRDVRAPRPRPATTPAMQKSQKPQPPRTPTNSPQAAKHPPKTPPAKRPAPKRTARRGASRPRSGG